MGETRFLRIGFWFFMVCSLTALGLAEWRVMPIRSQSEFERGRIGGEGEQHPQSIARCLSDPNVIYLSHDCGQVWKSTDGGDSWQKTLGIGLYLPFGQSIEVDPFDPDHVFVIISASYNWLSPGEQGLYRSVDGGQRWQRVLAPEVSFPDDLCRVDQHAIAYDATSREGNRTRRWFAAFPDDGLYRSEDFGQSWQKTVSLAGHVPVYQVRCHPTVPNVVYLATGQGLFLTGNCGGMLYGIGGLPAGPVSSVAVNPSCPGQVFVTVLDNGLYESQDGGATFALRRAFDAWRVEMNPGHPQTLFLSGTSSNTIISHDGGQTWITDMVTEPEEGLGRAGTSWKRRIAGELTGIVPNPQDPNEAAAYSRATLWKTVDGGHVFQDSSTLFTGFAWGWGNNSMAFDLFDPNRFFFFNFDVGMTVTGNGGDWFERRNDQAWGWYQQDLIGWIGTCAGDVSPEPNSPVLVAAIGSYWNHQLMRSEDEGRTWALVTQEPAHNFFVVFHPDDPNLVYAGNKISTDKGITFEPVDFGEFWWKSPVLVGMCRSRPDTVYAMDSGRYELYRSDDRGQSWRLYTKPGWRMRRVDSKPTFAADPADPNVVYTLSADQDLAVFDGNSWRSTGVLALAGGIDKGNFVRSVTVDPRHPEVLYAGMYLSGSECIWRSVDKGYTWRNISENLPRLSIETLAVSPHTGELFHGSVVGTWVYPPPYEGPTPVYDKLMARPVDWKFGLADFAELSRQWLGDDPERLSLLNLDPDEEIGLLDLCEFVQYLY